MVELGAGNAIATIRHACEEVAEEEGATLLRINLRDGQVPAGSNALSLPLGALEALEKLDAALGRNP